MRVMIAGRWSQALAVAAITCVPTFALAVDAEREAKRLFVEAAAVYQQSPCGLVTLITEISGLDGSEPTPGMAQRWNGCLDDLQRVSEIYGRLFTEYPDTEAAFQAARSQFLSPADISSFRDLISLRRQSAGSGKSLKRLLPSD